MDSSTLAGGGTIVWLSGSSTTLGTPVLTAAPAKKCPGYVKKAPSTYVEPVAYKLSAAVTGDTGDGIKVPGTLTGEICISSALNVTSLKPLKIK